MSEDRRNGKKMELSYFSKNRIENIEIPIEL